MKFKQTLLLAGLLMVFGNVNASNSSVSSDVAVEDSEQHAVEQNHVIHWGYSGAEGPSQWQHLSDDYLLCGSGKRQSPVDLKKAEENNLYPLSFHYKDVPLQVVNNGHTLQANYNKLNDLEVDIAGRTYPLSIKKAYESQLMLGTVPYDLLQFHFHSPSEHARKGERYAMEVHLVHKSADGNLAVVGVFLESGEHNATLQKVLDNLSDTINEIAVTAETKVNAQDLLPDGHDFYHYSGSLTTPPCSENVNWFVMKKHIEVSAEQVRRFASLVGENARPLQTMHWRTLLTSN